MTKQPIDSEQDAAPLRRKELFSMTWPMLLGIVSLMSFQLADSMFIARLGIAPLAVIGLTIPIYQVFIGVQVGIGIATTALISQLLGAKKNEEAVRLAGVIVAIGASAIAIIALCIWLARYQILEFLGGEASLRPLVDAFWSVWLISAFTGAFLYFGYSICRAHGNTMLPGSCMVLTSLLNIALDPLFIFTFELGLAGAAWASIASFGAGWLLVYPKVFKKHWLTFTHISVGLVEQCLKVMSIALPAMMSQLLPALASILATSLVAQYGTESIAAWGLGIRVEFFSLILVLAMTMSLPQMIGRRFGEKNFVEIQALLKLAIQVVFLWQIILAALLYSFSGQVSLLLAGNEAITEELSWFIIFIPISYAPLGVCMLLVSSTNAVSQAFSGLFISFVRLFICYLPFLALGAELGGLKGLMIGAAVGNVIAGICAWFLYKKAFAKAQKKALYLYR
jgi:putative MATE family efflux protein